MSLDQDQFKSVKSWTNVFILNVAPFVQDASEDLTTTICMMMSSIFFLVHFFLSFSFSNSCGFFFFGTGEIHIGGQEHFYMETQSVLAIPKGEDKEMDVYVSTQHPAFIQVIQSILREHD